MRFIRAILAILARLFLSVIFLASSVNQIIYWKETEKMFMNVLSDWQTYTVSSEWLQRAFSMMTTWSLILLMIHTCLEILGALLLLFGLKEKTGAFLLILVLIPTSVLVQHFWFSETGLRELQLSLFLRDLAILGGLLTVVLRGTKEKTRIEDFEKSSGFG